MASRKTPNEHFDAEKVSGEPSSPLTHEESDPVACEIPNGGFTAWLQVVGAFCIFLNTW